MENNNCKEKITCQFDGTTVKVRFTPFIDDLISSGFNEILRNSVFDYNKHYRKTPCVQISHKKNDPFLRAMISHLFEYERPLSIGIDSLKEFLRKPSLRDISFERYITRVPEEMMKTIKKVVFRNRLKYYYPYLYDMMVIANGGIYNKYSTTSYRGQNERDGNLFRAKVNMALEEFKMLGGSPNDKMLFSKIYPKISYHIDLVNDLLRGKNKISFAFSKKGDADLLYTPEEIFDTLDLKRSEYCIDISVLKKYKTIYDRELDIDNEILNEMIADIESEIVTNDLNKFYPNALCYTRALAEFFLLVLFIMKPKDLADSRVIVLDVCESYFYNLLRKSEPSNRMFATSPVNDDSDDDLENESESE